MTIHPPKQPFSLLFIHSLQVQAGHHEVSLETSLLKLNKPSSLNLSSQERCSSPLAILVALLWTSSKNSTSFLCWGPQAWTQCSTWGLTRAE